MKKVIFLIFIALGVQHIFAKEDKNLEKIYNSTFNAKNDINLAVKRAKTEGREWMIHALQFYKIMDTTSRF